MGGKKLFWKSSKRIGAGADRKWRIDGIIITITDQGSLSRNVHICALLNQRLYYENILSG